MPTFEIPACSGFMLHESSDEILEFFEESREIAFFSTPDESREKIDYYLSKNELWKYMAEKAFQKIQKHTYYNRVQKILGIYTEMKKRQCP